MADIQVMVNGLPGNMATEAANAIAAADGLILSPFALTGEDTSVKNVVIAGKEIELIKPDKREGFLKADIAVDYTHPSAVNDNADFYCRQGLPFVMGTTGGDRVALEQRVIDSNIAAVIAPNMAKQIVGFQAMMEYCAETFPGVFKGYDLQIKESHQQGKADTSGTAKAMMGSFNELGAVPFTKDQILMERDPEVQRKEWGIPERYLGGHGWHTYSLRSEDDTVFFQFTHNVNGRKIYADGTVDAIRYLDKKVREGEKGKVYSMIDVLKGK